MIKSLVVGMIWDLEYIIKVELIGMVDGYIMVFVRIIEFNNEF